MGSFVFQKEAAPIPLIKKLSCEDTCHFLHPERAGASPGTPDGTRRLCSNSAKSFRNIWTHRQFFLYRSGTNGFCFSKTFQQIAGKSANHPKDATGLSAHYAALSPGLDLPDNDELNMEAFYKFQLTSWINIKPDLQYIIHPGGRYKNTFVGTLLLNFSFNP